MTTCVWCGRPSDGAAACLRCAPDQGHARDPDQDVIYEPTEIEAASLENLRALLDAEGITPIEFQPEEPEWLDLNEERFLTDLHERR